MTLPWRVTNSLETDLFADVRLRTIFECCRWDAQVEGVSLLADFALVLNRLTWAELAEQSERLAGETLAAEQELILRPDLHHRLGLPRSVTRLWKQPIKRADHIRDVRLIRFDFHLTTEGWRISEANTDMPSGLIEASGFSRLIGEHFPTLKIAGDPAEMIAKAVRSQLKVGEHVAMVHATALTNDRQVMGYLAQHIEQTGLHPVLVSPAQVLWKDQTAEIVSGWQQSPASFVIRFFPTELLPNLLRSCPWQGFFRATHVPFCNPTTALLVQTKRFPLVWDALQTPLPTWRSILPETRDPHHSERQGRDSWILKPALGRSGENIGIVGITKAKDLSHIRRRAHLTPWQWVIQRRFEPIPLEAPNGIWYPCIGVYTVNGRAAGIHGRITRSPLTDATCTDIAVLIDT